MNFNANTGSRQSLGARKIKRVSDVNAMGYAPYAQQPPQQPTGQLRQHGGLEQPQQPFGYPSSYPDPNVVGPSQTPNAPQYPPNMQAYNSPMGGQSQYDPGTPFMVAPTNLGNVFAQPIVQDIAAQYGQKLADSGKTMVQEGVQKYVPVSQLKYYFAVDTKYVLSKLGLLFFPFVHKDWSLKFEQDGNPVQPRFEVNAPDLYIPTMAYFTYIVVAALALGTQSKFSPEQIVMQASSAVAWWIVELALYSTTLYISHIETSLRTLDLLAYSGFKYVTIIACVVASLVAGRTGYYLCLLSTSFSLAFFLIRTLKSQVLLERQSTNYYDNQPMTGSKRRLYFLLFVAAAQPVLSWWLSYHLVSTPRTT